MKEAEDLRALAEQYGQEHVFRFWDSLNKEERGDLLTGLSQVDFVLMKRLIEEWVLSEPPPETFTEIRPVPMLPKASDGGAQTQEALEAGEEALRAGKFAFPVDVVDVTPLVQGVEQ